MGPAEQIPCTIRLSFMHDHAHSHGHGHGHHHHHHHHAHPRPDDGSRLAFPLAVGLNSAFVAIEFGYGFWANSTALMADAGHNLSDVLGLFLAWGAALLSRRQPGGRYTYGLASTSILAALANAMLLLVACGAIALEAIQRLMQPAEVAGLAVTLVAAAGILVNGFSAWLFMAGSRHDLNQRAAWLHMLGDAGISLAVVIGGLIIMRTGWLVVDPILSLLIVAAIFASTWGLLRESFRLSVKAVPGHIDLQAVQEFLAAQPEVEEVQDLHIWAMSTTETALTVSLVVPQAPLDDALLDRLELQLHQSFGIGHSTIELRRLSGRACSLDPVAAPRETGQAKN